MTRSEDVLGEKIDRCFADSLLKISGGIAIGVVASVAFFKVPPFWIFQTATLGKTMAHLARNWIRTWDWLVQFFVRISLAFQHGKFRHDLAQPYLLHGKKVLAGQDSQGKPQFNIVTEKTA